VTRFIWKLHVPSLNINRSPGFLPNHHHKLLHIYHTSNLEFFNIPNKLPLHDLKTLELNQGCLDQFPYNPAWTMDLDVEDQAVQYQGHQASVSQALNKM
jgi:hypothetical protein